MTAHKLDQTFGDRDMRPKERAIYVAAAEVFYAKGFAAATNQEIADKVGMLKGSLYHYISSKEDLLYGVIEDAYLRLIDLLNASENLDVDTVERLKFFISGYTTLACENYMTFAVGQRDLRLLPVEKQRAIIVQRDRYETFLRTLIQTGQREGIISDTIDVALASIALFSMMNSLHVWFSPSGSMTAQEVGDKIATLFLDGLISRQVSSRNWAKKK